MALLSPQLSLLDFERYQPSLELGVHRLGPVDGVVDGDLPVGQHGLAPWNRHQPYGNNDGKREKEKGEPQDDTRRARHFFGNKLHTGGSFLLDKLWQRFG